MSKVPIREGLFTQRTEGELIGFRCKSCGHILPPLTITCLSCNSDDLQSIPLSGKGTLYSYTINYMNSGFMKAPYAGGLVKLSEGFWIYSVLKEKEGKPFVIGMNMELVVEALWEKDGNEVIGHKFQPVA
ncbi:MAG: hypothetical protein A4E65_03072 [Syntrophorhabdus sp. PtaU1.Bin153]|nr:MAG: hypothetical protein A4E65_03072 [Syntrophorhabdus sp. PtaU1.Bin153]